MSVWTLDEVARTSDESVVRSRFDRRNSLWLIALMFVFSVVGLLELTTSRSNLPFDVLVAASTLGLSAFGLFLFMQRRVRWLHEHVSATVITWCVTQYALVLAFTREGEWNAWAMTFPLLMLAFRMPAAELVLIHVCYVVGGVMMQFFFGGRGSQLYIGVIVMNGVMLAAELFMSHRMRRNVINEWSARRSQAREQIRMRDELRYARELQVSMLPACAPELDWLDICASSSPATEVGGDYYDYFIGEGNVALVCGDVAGHGMAAGLVLASIRSGFTLLRDQLHDPAGVLRRLHDLVAETSRRRMLVTVSVVLLDRATRQATIASAGHPPVLIRRADGSVETIDLWAVPLGTRLPVNIPQRRLLFQPGDMFILHSDGIYETRNVSGEVYGLDRLASTVRDANPESAAALLNAILKDVTHFRGNAEMDDDMTLVVARVR